MLGLMDLNTLCRTFIRTMGKERPRTWLLDLVIFKMPHILLLLLLTLLSLYGHS